MATGTNRGIWISVWGSRQAGWLCRRYVRYHCPARAISILASVEDQPLEYDRPADPWGFIGVHARPGQHWRQTVQGAKAEAAQWEQPMVRWL